MSTTGRQDDAGDPGAQMDERFTWKNGFNLKCGLPLTLLLERVADGPWQKIQVGRELKIVKQVGDDVVTAWVGRVDQTILAGSLVQRFNGYETARDFPPTSRGT